MSDFCLLFEVIFVFRIEDDGRPDSRSSEVVAIALVDAFEVNQIEESINNGAS